MEETMETDRRDHNASPQEERRLNTEEREKPRPEHATAQKPRAPQSQHTAPGYEDEPGAGEDEGEHGRKRPEQEPGDAAAREHKDG